MSNGFAPRRLPGPHPQHLAQQVPESHVQPGDGLPQHNPILYLQLGFLNVDIGTDAYAVIDLRHCVLCIYQPNHIFVLTQKLQQINNIERFAKRP